MADAIVIQVKLGTDEIARAGQEIARKLSAALDGAGAGAREAGRRIGDAFSAGLESSVRRARQLRDQLDSVLTAPQRYTTIEGKERAHQQRLQVIREQAAAALQQVEARRQAQLDVIRERAIQREIEQQRRLERAAQGTGGFATFLRRYSSLLREAGESIQQAGEGFTRFSALLINFGRLAVRSAVDIDRQVNVLKSLTGSAEAAEARYRQLVETALRTPGLTANLAATLDAQLRVASVTEQTINRILPAIGKLNAISPIADPQRFAQNLVQLVTQNFEKIDLKELVGQSPVAGEIIKQLFNVDSPTNSKAIREAAKRLGLNATDAFFATFAEAAARNPKLANVTESLGAQFEKLRDRVLVALRPLGLTIVNTLAPIVERLIPVIERVSRAFAELPEGTRQAIVIFGLLVAAIGPLLIALGGLIQGFGAVGNIITVILGAGGGAALGGSGLLALAGVLGIVGAAVGLLALAWRTNFADIQAIVADAGQFLRQQFAAVSNFFAENREDLAALGREFRRFSNEVAPIVRGFWDLYKLTASDSLQVVLYLAKVTISAITFQLQLLTDQINRIKTAFSFVRAVGAQAAFPALSGLGKAVFEEAQRPAEARAPSFPKRSDRATALGLQEQIDALNEQRKLQETRKRLTEEGTKTAAAGADKLRQIREAQNAFAEAADRNRLQLLEDTLRREQETLQSAYDRQLISTREFYDNKRELTVAGLDAELDALTRQQAAIERAIGGAQGAEKIRLEERLNEVLTQQIRKRNEILDVTRRSLDEFKKAVGTLPDVDLTRQLQVEDAAPQRILEARAKLNDLKEQGAQFDLLENRLRLEEERIQNQITLGVLDEVDGRRALLAVEGEFREAMLASLAAERERREILGDREAVGRIDLEIERLQFLGVELTNVQRFLRGFGRETESVGDAFERFGQNVAGAFRNLKDLFTGLKNAVNQFFADLVGNALQRLVRGALGAVFGGQSAGGGGIAGLGGIFTTPSFNPNAGRGGLLGNVLGSIFSSNLTAPTSVSNAGGLPAGRTFPVPLSSPPVLSPATGVLSQALGSRNFLSRIFGALTGGGAVSLLPALAGIGLGAGLGGQSVLGQLLGGAGGAAVGLGIAFGSAVFGAGGGLGAAALAALGPAALIGAPLLIGALLLGRAKQRRADEAASGDFLTEAINSIRSLKAQVERDQIAGEDARRVFETEILQTFIAQINTLKTRSVRESRRTNQVRDLRNLFEKEVAPAIAAQKLRQETVGKLLPEFAFGGFVPGIDRGFDSVLSLLRPGEMVLTVQHQQKIQQLAGADIFGRVGVPGAAVPTPGALPAFAAGGIAPRLVSATAESLVIDLDITVGMSESGAEELFVAGARSRSGQQVLVNINRKAQKNRELN